LLAWKKTRCVPKGGLSQRRTPDPELRRFPVVAGRQQDVVIGTMRLDGIVVRVPIMFMCSSMAGSTLQPVLRAAEAGDCVVELTVGPFYLNRHQRASALCRRRIVQLLSWTLCVVV
jgi:hypothetical protein